MTEKEKFFQILKDNTYGIFPAPTDAQLAVNVLCEYLLGEDWHTVVNNTEQANTCIVDAILYKYSRQYRKDIRKSRRERDG